MITDMNKVELIGTVGSVHSFKVGEQPHTRFSLVTKAAYDMPSGEAVIETTWHHVVVWTDLRVARGDTLRVVGRIKQKEIIQEDGTVRIATEILASEVSKYAEKSTYETISSHD